MPRVYDTELRDGFARQTRERILAGARAVLAEGAAAFSVTRVAREAGVGLRTVYVHFPSKAALLEAAAPQIQGGIPGLDGTTVESPRELVYRLQRGFTALAATLPPPPEANERLTASHEQVALALAPALRALPPRERRMLLNAVLLVADGRSAATAREALGMDAPDTGQLVAWTVEMLIRNAGDRG